MSLDEQTASRCRLLADPPRLALQNDYADRLRASGVTPSELALLEALAAERRAALATLVFSAKEAFYECQHALTGAWLEFGDVTLELDGPGDRSGAFRVRPRRALASPLLAGRVLRGRFHFAGDLVLTGIAIGVQA